MLTTNPAEPTEKFDEPEFKKYVPPKAHIKMIFQIANAFEKDLIKIAYHTLARSVEIRRLKKVDCDFVNRLVYFKTRKRKGGAIDKGSVEMDNTAYEILKRRCEVTDSDHVFPKEDGEMLTKDIMGKIMPYLFRRLNNYKDKNGHWKLKPKDEQIKSFGFHAIRHHVAAHLYLNHGYNLAEMQKILRHKRATTTDEYLKSIVNMKATRGLSVLDEDNFETKFTSTKSAGELVGYPSTLNRVVV